MNSVLVDLLDMGKTYTYQGNQERCLKARSDQERVHFKPMFETGRAIKGMKAEEAIKYLEAVCDHKRAVPFFRYNEGVPHHAQGHEWGCPQARWPVKSAKLFLRLIKNALAAAPQKPGLDVAKLCVAHVECNRAKEFRWRRIHQAHGRVKSYCSPPTTVQIILAEPASVVERAE